MTERFFSTDQRKADIRDTVARTLKRHGHDRVRFAEEMWRICEARMPAATSDQRKVIVDLALQCFDQAHEIAGRVAYSLPGGN